jgi:hypothetical protein
MVKIKSAAIVIAKLDGARSTARLTGRKLAAVYHWKKRGIPLAMRDVIEAALRKRGEGVPHPSVWSQEKYRRIGMR